MFLASKNLFQLVFDIVFTFLELVFIFVFLIISRILTLAPSKLIPDSLAVEKWVALLLTL